MNIQELIKGIIIGIAKIIPGLSGAVLMISFNLYDRAIDAITNFFKNPKRNIFFLLNLGIGIVIGIVLFSKIINFFLNKYYLYTTMLFLGLIIGGIPVINNNISKKKSNYIFIILSFSLMLIITLISSSNHYIIKNNIIDLIVFFLSGILEAIGTILPGISSTALLMLIGVYDNYIMTLSNALNINLISETLYFIIPFSIGMLFGIVIISLLVNFLFKSYKEKTFSVILGISISTLVTLFIKLFPYINSLSSLIISTFILIIGYILTNKLI